MRMFCCRIFCAIGFSLCVAQIAQAQGDSLLINLPARSWYRVENTKMRDVCPENGMSRSSELKDCAAVIENWSGATYDTRRNRLLVWGGGHDGYYGNEVYAFDIDNLEWQRLTDPSPISGYGACGNAPETLADGNPNSRHTYSKLTYVEYADVMLSTGGSLACKGGGQGSVEFWAFDVANSAWEHLHPQGDVLDDTDWGRYAIYEPVSRYVYLQHKKGFLRYDFDKNELVLLSGGSTLGHISVALDTKRMRIYVIAGSQWDPPGTWHYRDLTSNDYQQVNLPRAGGEEMIDSDAPGLQYDPVADELVLWHGGDIYTFDIENETWSSYSVPGGPQSSPTNGMYGRWRYVPKCNVFIAVTDVDEDVYFYKHTTGGGTVTGIGTPEEKPEELRFELRQNYPNPFNPETQISFSVPDNLTGQKVKVAIYDILGKRVRTILNKQLKAGYQTVLWDGRDDHGKILSSGVYFYRLEIDKYKKIKKMLMVR